MKYTVHISTFDINETIRKDTRALNYNVYMQITQHEMCTVQAQTVKCEVVLLTQERQIAKLLFINKNDSVELYYSHTKTTM